MVVSVPILQNTAEVSKDVKPGERKPPGKKIPKLATLDS